MFYRTKTLDCTQKIVDSPLPNLLRRKTLIRVSKELSNITESITILSFLAALRRLYPPKKHNIAQFSIDITFCKEKNGDFLKILKIQLQLQLHLFIAQ